MKDQKNNVKTANQRIGETVKALRERLKITQEQLSQLAKIDKEDLHNLENGDFEQVSSEIIKAMISICPYLNISLDYLLVSQVEAEGIILDRERFYDFEGKEIDLYKIARNLYSVDAEFLLLLSSPDFLSNRDLISKLKEIILSSSKN